MNSSKRLTNVLRQFAALLMLSIFTVPPSVMAQAEDEGQAEDTAQTENEARAENAGQADLDEAIKARIAVSSFRSMTKVVDLAQAALDKGLNEANKEIAESLLAGMLMDRAAFVSAAITDQPTPDPRWPDLRKSALADLDRLLDIDTNRPRAHFLKGRLLALPGGERTEAISALDKAAETAGEDNIFHAKVLTFRGNLQTEEAKRLADYEAAIKIAPSQPEALRTRALFFLYNQKIDEAIADLDRALELDGDHAPTHETRGMAFYVKKDFDEALVSFNRALELNPESPTVPMHLGRLFAAQGDYKAAVAELDKAVGFRPKEPNVLLLRSQMRAAADDTEGALADIDEVIQLLPGNVAAQRMRAELLRVAGKMDEAIASLERARGVLPDDQTLMFQLGVFYSANQQTQEAIGAFNALLAVNGQNWQVLRSRGDAYLNLGDRTKALSDYEAALALQPEDSSLLNNLSWLLSTAPDDDLRDGNRALELAIKACELTDYKQSHILSTLAAAHAEKGDFTKAIEWSEKSVELSDESLLPQLTKELDSYKASKPWREEDTAGEEKPAP